MFQKRISVHTLKSPKKPVIVWDAGGVFLNWDIEKFSKSYDNGRHKTECLAMFNSENWKKFDRGDLSYEDMLNIYSKKFNLSKEKINEILQSAFHSLSPNWPVVNLIKELGEQGYQQYCLTNGSKEYMNYVNSKKYQSAYGFLFYDLFDQHKVLLSADLNVAKPEAQIYQYAREKFKLSDEFTIFIDDNEINLTASKRQNWHTIQFRDFESCLAQLEKLGVRLDKESTFVTEKDSPGVELLSRL